MTRPRISVGLLWHSLTSGNLGVGALTVGNVALAREAAARAGVDLRFVVLAPRDPGTPLDLGEAVEVVPIDGRGMVGGPVWRAIGGVDCMLDIGAGDSFTDIYGGKRYLYMIGTKLMTLARGVPLVLSPQTIGPFTKAGYSHSAGMAMTRARLTVARDPLSYDEIARLAPRAKRLMAADVAFRLPFTRPAARTDGKVHVGLNVSGLLWRKGNKAGPGMADLHRDYVDFTRRLIDRLRADPAVAIHFVTHANDHRGADDDGSVADALAAEYPGTIRVPDFADPSAAKSYISGLDFLVAARMHACIAAFSSGVPVIPVAYSRKFHGLFEGILNYPHVLTLGPTGVDRAVEIVTDGLARRDALAAETRAGNAHAQAMLEHYVDALADLFAGFAAKAK